MRLSITVTVLAVSTAYAASGQTLAERFLLTDTLANKPASEVLANPVLTPMLSRVSLSHAAAGFDRASLGEVAVRPTEGKGRAEGWFDADAYIKNGRATITGNASYSNGRRYGVEYCQVSDPEMVFPYFTAVDACGDFKNEVYTFGGSYSSDFHEGKWLYGVRLGYRAVQEYRDADPRPKNTVGQLSLAVGFGGRFGPYIVSLGLDAFKYRQSNNIMFVSELGEQPVYHLTGMTSHYARFAGTGKSAGYDGWSRGASVDLYPATEGAYASLSWHRFTFTKTLKELNNLPLNDAVVGRYVVSGGWKAEAWSVSAGFEYDCRTGTENIFGDPAGNVYPELFALTTYGWRRTAASLKGAWRHLAGDWRADVYAAASYRFIEEVYKGVVPHLRSVEEEWFVDAEAQLRKTLSRKISISASIAGEAILSRYYAAGASAGVDYILSGNKSIGLSAGYKYRTATGFATGYALTSSLVFKF